MSLSTFSSDPFKFLKKISIFIGILFLLNVIYFFVLKNIDEYRNYFVVYAKNEFVTTIILSDSRGNVIKDEMLDSTVYNFSFGSDSYFDMFLKLGYAIKNFPKLETVILTVDEHCYLSYRSKYNNTDKSIVFSDYKTYSTLHPINKVNYFLSVINSKYFPIVSKKNTMLVFKYLENRIKKGSSDKIEIQKRWCEYPIKEQLKLEEDRFNFQFNSKFDPEVADAFIQIVNNCKKQKLKLIGVRFPLTAAYLQKMKTLKIPEITATIEKSNIKVIDFTNSIFNNCLYENQDHLNNEGARLFTDSLFVPAINAFPN